VRDRDRNRTRKGISRRNARSRSYRLEKALEEKAEKVDKTVDTSV
jgi:hypothetical protein